MIQRKLVSMGVILFLIIPLISLNYSSYETDDISNHFSFNFRFEQPLIEHKNQYNRSCCEILLENTTQYARFGCPRLPVKSVSILLPKNAELDSISLSTNSPITLNEKINRITFSSNTFPLSSPQNNWSPSHCGYDNKSFFPQQLYNNIGIQYLKGFPILHVNIHPVQYHGERKIIRYYPEMTLHISVKNTSVQHHLYRGLEKDVYTVFNKVDLLKPSIVSSYDIKKPREEQQLIKQSRYEYVIITTQDFKDYYGSYDLHDLIDKRQQQGLSAKIKTVEEIYAEFPGVDNPERIRNFITYAYRHWQTDWVLLAGDAEFIPVRYLKDVDGGDTELASDLYYQCLDGDFNADHDFWYGEKHDGVNGSIIDLYAEVYLGRACVDCPDQIENFVFKTLSYENYQWGVDPALENVLSVGEHLWNGEGEWAKGYLERCIDFCSDYGQNTNAIPSSRFEIKRFYEKDGIYDEIELRNEIIDGVQFINHMSHTSPTYAMRFSIEELFNLNNTFYPLWYSQGCHAGQFQAIDECIAEAWTVGPYGGFAAVMNTGFGYGSNTDYDGPDNRFAREFWDALNSSQEKISRIGKAIQDAKEDNIWRIDDGHQMYHNYYCTTLFADPFVQIKGMEDFKADYTWTPLLPKVNSSIRFIDKSIGAKTYYWDFDDGNTASVKNPTHQYNTEGEYHVTLTITDHQDQQMNITRCLQVFYNWPPIAVLDPQQLATNKSQILFNAANSWDPDGNITSYHWDFDDGSYSDEMITNHTFPQDGEYIVTLTLTDNKGKQTSEECYIYIDQCTPPRTEVAFGGQIGENNWLISPAQIYLKSSDWSGINNIYYSLDEMEWKTYDRPFFIDENGNHTISYYAEDIWGTKEHIHTETFAIDTHPPAVNIRYNATKQKGWFTSPVEITCTGTDSDSGLHSMYYRIREKQSDYLEYTDPLCIHDDGMFTFNVFAKDYAGLYSDRNHYETLAIDQQPPKTVILFSGNPSPGNQMKITLHSEDTGIGVDAIWYSLNNQPYQSYTNPLLIDDAGNQTISFYAVDKLGHTEPVQTMNFTMGIVPKIQLISPTNGLYHNGEKIMELPHSIMAIGAVPVKCRYYPSFLTIQNMTFSIDDELIKTMTQPEFNWLWDASSFGQKKLTIKANFIDFSLQLEQHIIKLF